ncbi:ABC transporter permease/substrate-binding protein [Saccharibacillus sp. CPCC 101409]|uniref:ABC transporter permease/substrate-binding protein n=1 Tax=Saccharibacillus sp. CPCC 101409 TaxID=3058041 RepID=UPI0026740496|nr:ABC transporter permease/substrate-binding protein [Saccharibacillus sp. CPCC 101409]MDO3408351.1 ABC transporter permease/substrate-binding protein [Saccharibacillus sp. CPCC 101409]
MKTFFDVLGERQSQLWNVLGEHIALSFIALLLAALIAVPLGLLLARHPKGAEGVIGVTAVLQTIPSLALLGLLIPLLGIGRVPAVVALVIYALLPILRNTYTGVREVDPSLLEAADAMGMNARQRLLKVELPLAMPVVMAGIRTATVLIIGTATLAALIGGGGLGELILLGIDRNDTNLILLGAIPAALLAIVFDFALRFLEKLSFRRSLTALGGFAVVILLFLLIPLFGQGGKADLVIAGKLGAEPEILINMYKDLIEQDTDLNVELKPGFGKTSFVFSALQNGDIDIYPEFTGTAISEFMKTTAVSTDAKAVYEQARDGMKQQFNIALLAPMAYNNTYAVAMSKKLAEQYKVEKISDLKPLENNLEAGFTLEFSDREDGYLGIQKLYGIKFHTVFTMEPKLRYQAIESGDIDLLDAYSTDSELAQYDLTVLEDDKGLFPPYQGAPMMLQSTLDKHPELADTLNVLAGQITDDEMRQMNYAVNAEGRPAADVARDFLTEKGLLKAE